MSTGYLRIPTRALIGGLFYITPESPNAKYIVTRAHGPIKPLAVADVGRCVALSSVVLQGACREDFLAAREVGTGTEQRAGLLLRNFKQAAIIQKRYHLPCIPIMVI